MKHKVPMEKSLSKSAAAEDFPEECFNRRRAYERRWNMCITARPWPVSSCTSYEGGLPGLVTRKATGKAGATPTKSSHTGKAEVMGAPGEPPVLRPGILTKNGPSPKIQVFSCARIPFSRAPSAALARQTPPQ